MKFDLNTILAFIKPFISMFGADAAHTAVDRLVTFPKAQRMSAYKGMSEDDIAEAERLHAIRVDACSDYLVFVVTRGAVEAD